MNTKIKPIQIEKVFHLTNSTAIPENTHNIFISIFPNFHSLIPPRMLHALAMNDVHIFFMASRMNDEKSFPYLKYFPIDLSIENDHLYDKSLSLFFMKL